MTTKALTMDPLQKLELRTRLLSLPFEAFARCLGDLLSALGYRDVSLAGRTQWKGRNTSGGFDIEAALSSGLGHRRVVAQVKQFSPEQRVYQRAVDELRGVALREWAGEALLLTTGPVSSAIREPSSAVIPVRVLGGDALLEALAESRVGVAEAENRLTVDRAYFDRLTAQCRGDRSRYDRQDCPQGNPMPGHENQPETFTLTLTLPVSLVHTSEDLTPSPANPMRR